MMMYIAVPINPDIPTIVDRYVDDYMSPPQSKIYSIDVSYGCFPVALNFGIHGYFLAEFDSSRQLFIITIPNAPTEMGNPLKVHLSKSWYDNVPTYIRDDFVEWLSSRTFNIGNDRFDYIHNINLKYKKWAAEYGGKCT